MPLRLLLQFSDFINLILRVNLICNGIMNILYFDCISGISGDMVLSAFIDMGMDVDELKKELEKLEIGSFSLSVKKIIRNGINASHLDVIAGKGSYHRDYYTIEGIIGNSNLSERVKEISKKIFYRLASAESKVHSKPIDKVHFHEVGAVDSIIDIVGTAICLDKFDIAKIYSSPLKLGSGFVHSEHGIIPVPAPATVELVKNYPVIKTSIQTELTTPTGAAIVTSLSEGVIERLAFDSFKYGYGAGTKEIEDIPNLLRIFIGEVKDVIDYDEVLLVETNIDDMNPELYTYIFDRLFKNDALDVFITPLIMKKGRPGNMLSVLCERNDFRKIFNVIFEETTTIGIRTSLVKRLKQKRGFVEVETPFGKVKAKRIEFEDKVKIIPEYEECRIIAEKNSIPLINVYEVVQRFAKNKD